MEEKRSPIKRLLVSVLVISVSSKLKLIVVGINSSFSSSKIYSITNSPIKREGLTCTFTI